MNNTIVCRTMHVKTIVVYVTFKKIGLLLKWMEKKRETTLIELKNVHRDSGQTEQLALLNHLYDAENRSAATPRLVSFINKADFLFLRCFFNLVITQKNISPVRSL